MDEEINIACLGDSLTAGSPGFTGYGTWSGNQKSQYEYWLEQKIEGNCPDLEVVIGNFGVGGNTVWQMLYRFKRDVFRLMPDVTHVLIFAGINDILGHGALATDVIADLDELYDFIESKGVKVIPMDVGPASTSKLYLQRIATVNDWIKNWAQKHDRIFISTHDFLADDGKWIKPEYDIGDGVHFSVAGYKAIGEGIFEVLKANLFKK